MQALGVGYHPEAILPDWWHDHWKDFFHFWSRIAKARVKDPSPFAGLFLIVSNAAERWRRSLPSAKNPFGNVSRSEDEKRRDERYRAAEFRDAGIDPALYEAIRHVFWVISVSEQEPDDIIVTPLSEWRTDRRAYEWKHIDHVANDHIDGWSQETMQPIAPEFIAISTICTKCGTVVTPRKQKTAP